MIQKIFKVLTILLLFPVRMFAFAESPDEWITAMKVEDVDMSVVWLSKANIVTADNGLKYKRISVYDDVAKQDVPQSLGFRSEDRKLYVLDFETGIETVAFDFNLSVGDEFTTMNGMEWVVSEVADTLHHDEPHKLLNVYSKDGKWEDQWLEGFGSLTNRLMDTSIEDVDISFIPYCYFEGRYFMNMESTPLPFYSHLSPLMKGAQTFSDINSCPPPVHPLVYDSGKLTFYFYDRFGPARYYSLFYRSGDDFYHCTTREFFSLDESTPMWQINEIVFEGLPEPTSGAYRMYTYGDVYDTTNLRAINTNTVDVKMYDLQGRRLKAEPQKGVFIKDGQKVLK